MAAEWVRRCYKICSFTACAWGGGHFLQVSPCAAALCTSDENSAGTAALVPHRWYRSTGTAALVPQRCWGCCWAVLAQPQGLLCLRPQNRRSREAGAGSGLGGDVAGAADPNWCSIPYDVTLSNKNSGKAGGKGNVRGYGVCLPKQLRPRFLGGGWMSACQWKRANELLILLCYRAQLLLSVLNCHYLYPWVFLLSFYFLLTP